ncbi:hypothetical protein V9K67_16965 [Paraflavisolibacter sp. H34]|uniref:hypothetical protein n=1 Tax=Huijunlia imazamoxiresistens TaxID=3127457 RepID=UPI003016952C
MNKIFYGKACFLLALLTVFCSKHNDQEPAADRINGNWEWVRTDGGIAHHIHETPRSTGRQIEVSLTTDRKYWIYTNGVLTARGTYTLEKKQCIHDRQLKPLIRFSSSADSVRMVETITPDTLLLSDEAYDGLTSQYRRVSPGGNLPK